MDGQVLGGGVIVLVAVVLWLVYLAPSWAQRHRFDSAQRNAVRLNQALRVLAETSETPEEVHLELSARTAAAQRRLARAALAEREQVALERAKAQAEIARIETEAAREHARAEADAERERARAEARTAKERVRAESLAARERAQAEAAAARAEGMRVRARMAAEHAAPERRRARARRRARLAVTVVAVASIGVAVWAGAVASAPFLLAAAIGVALLCAVPLRRMSVVERRAVVRVEASPTQRVSAVQDLALDGDRTEWTPRELPRPLSSSAGSRAAAVLDGVEAHEQLRTAVLEEAMRERAARTAPPSIDAARRARPAAHDDAAIEAHVRELLQRRASGQ